MDLRYAKGSDEDCMAQRSEQCDKKLPQDRLSGLPVELLSLIVKDLDVKNVFSLSLTSQSFWQAGRKHLHAFIMSLLGI